LRTAFAPSGTISEKSACQGRYVDRRIVDYLIINKGKIL